MEKKDTILIVVLAYLLVAAIIWVRVNLEFFRPILEDSTLFFKLIVAATVIAFLRNIVGFRTFGVFGPVIIAFGLVESGLFWGLALYLDIFILAMFTGLALHSLGLPSSHRMAIIITTTVIIITILELVSETFHVDVLQEAILFPVLITSWLADRFVKKVKELGWIPPSKRLAGTIIVTVIAYVVIMYQPLIDFVALNPESWGLIILVNIVLSLKVNFRLSEHLRFKPTIRSGFDRNSILSMNRRNRDLVFQYNPPHIYPLTTKDVMKVTLHQLGIPTPETFAIIQEKKDLPIAERVMAEQSNFVIKPSSGLGGEGIMVVERTEIRGENVDKRSVFRSKGREYSMQDLITHVRSILDGQFSSEWEDTTIIERTIITDLRMQEYTWKGVPDIRVIVLEGFPIMAMARLPTAESGGKANLHKGGLGLGLTIANGDGVNPFWREHGGTIERHPDTGAVLTDLRIPEWNTVLEIAARAQVASRLGYAGVDIVLDESGPMVLEVNKRPGLEIQNTNLAGLLRRIRFVEDRFPEHRFRPVGEKVALCREWDRNGWNETKHTHDDADQEAHEGPSDGIDAEFPGDDDDRSHQEWMRPTEVET